VPSGLDADLVEIPKDNPLTAAKVELGKLLFFDPRLSVDDTVACASCHSPQFGFSNGLATAIGVKGQRGGRSAPVAINRAFSTLQFWDGRAASLEEQALGPIQASIEMGHDLKAVVAKLKGIPGYRKRFDNAFGTDVTSEGIAKAIASFERTLLSGDSPFDRYEAGTKSALSPAGRRGLEIFRTKAKCTSCHVGVNFSDEEFHNIGVGMEKPNPDLGRFEVTKKEADRGAFKTPTLRDVALSAPYMHDGSLKTLEAVIDHYDRGGKENPWIDEKIKPLGLTDQEKQDLLAILKALTGAPIVVQVPPLPEP
jgi:cytochrome c peroxidase